MKIKYYSESPWLINHIEHAFGFKSIHYWSYYSMLHTICWYYWWRYVALL